MRVLSKSKIMSYLQCHKRLWLEVHRQDMNDVSASMQMGFDIGNQVGLVARRLYDPKEKGIVFQPMIQGIDEVVIQTKEFLSSRHPIFEAGFQVNGVRSFIDVMLPARRNGQRVWNMIEVKSSSEIKEHYLADVAIQFYIARAAGAQIEKASLAYVNSDFSYDGKSNYEGLLSVVDVTEHVFRQEAEVVKWIVGAHQVVKKRSEPAIQTGKHCSMPNDCGFAAYCKSQEQQAQFPVQWLPSINTTALKECLNQGITDLRRVPDKLLNPVQLRVKIHTISKQVYFDRMSAASELAQHKKPISFLDFETVNFAVPIWKGRRPYRQIPFQYSLHKLGRNGEVTHMEFLDLTGKDPAKRLAESLIAACGKRGNIFAYNASFEKMCLRDLAEFLPAYSDQLLAIKDRLVDLLAITKKYYYHPSQQGSWSIKKVLPAIAPELSYQDLSEVQNGGVAMQVYIEAIAKAVTRSRKAEIDHVLRRYCELDTYAMFVIWRFFSGYQQ